MQQDCFINRSSWDLGPCYKNKFTAGKKQNPGKPGCLQVTVLFHVSQNLATSCLRSKPQPGGKPFYLKDHWVWQSIDKLLPDKFTDQQSVCGASRDISPCPVWFQGRLHVSLQVSSVQRGSCFWASEAWNGSRDKHVTSHLWARKSKAHTRVTTRCVPGWVKENIH